MSQGALLIDGVVRDGKIEIVDRDFYRTRADRMAKKWGDGAALKIRIEPEEDAAWSGQFRYLFGQVIRPSSDHSGYTESEVCQMLKAEFLPEGMTSLTELNREQLTEFTRAGEEWCRQNWPEAFER